MTSSLSEFATKILAKNRITFADVKRLRRTILPAGIGSRHEAELLIQLDGQVGRVDPAWAPFLVPAIVEFMVWTERPTGILHEDTAQWLVQTFRASNAARTTRTARLIARELVEEAHAFENGALAALASSVGRGRRAASAVPVGPVAA